MPDAEQYMPDIERVGLALEALWEVDSIARMLCQKADGMEASDLWIRGVAARMVQLASAGMMSLGDGHENAPAVARKILQPFPLHV